MGAALGSSMKAMIRIAPPHFGQVSGNTSWMRASSMPRKIKTAAYNPDYLAKALQLRKI
jgi:hypothetical protein